MSNVPKKLLDAIKRVDRRHEQYWLEKLEARKIDELKFHDAYRARKPENSDQVSQSGGTVAADTFEVLTGNLRYYKTTQRSTSFIDGWLQKNLPGKVFLDFACGDGRYAIKASQVYGAQLSVGFDLSPESVDNAEVDAKKAGVSKNTIFIQADAENTRLPGESFDVILCSGMLHHLDLKHAFPELQRLLAPGGVVFCVEALDYNPLIKLYRYMTPGMRTEWEKAHILSLADISFAKKFFNVRNISYFHIFSPVGAHIPFLLPIFRWADIALEKIPIIQLLSWMFIFELKKK
jgi:ubiquinone/menaquinone biosynthesis C-methylase UbiE